MPDSAGICSSSRPLSISLPPTPVYPAARDALIRGYRRERPLSDEALERLPLFLAARGTTYLGWVHTRPGTETARELTPFLVERACAVAVEYLAGR